MDFIFYMYKVHPSLEIMTFNYVFHIGHEMHKLVWEYDIYFESHSINLIYKIYIN